MGCSWGGGGGGGGGGGEVNSYWGGSVVAKDGLIVYSVKIDHRILFTSLRS